MEDEGPPSFAFESADREIAFALRPRADLPGRPYLAQVTAQRCSAALLVIIRREPLRLFFEGIAHDWRGWVGERELRARLAGTDYSPPGLCLTATSDLRGRVRVQVEMGEPSVRSSPGHEHATADEYRASGDWIMEILLVLEPWQLETIAHDASRLPFDSEIGW